MTRSDLPRGTEVVTPNGPGRLWEIKGNKVTVEMDYRHLVEYNAEDVKTRELKKQSQEQQPFTGQRRIGRSPRFRMQRCCGDALLEGKGGYRHVEKYLESLEDDGDRNGSGGRYGTRHGIGGSKQEPEEGGACSHRFAPASPPSGTNADGGGHRGL